MAKRKTQYTMIFNADPNAVNNLIVNWLQINGFQYKEKYNTKFFQSGDGVITASRCFEYYFQGNQLVIYAYLKTPKNPFPLDNGMMGAMNTVPYVNLIQELMTSINNMSNQNMAYAQNAAGYGNPGLAQAQSQQQVMNQSINAFAKDNDKRQGNCAIWALVIGCLNLILCFCGFTFGVFILFIAYYMAIIGLKSSKKGIAILAIILTTISLAVFVMKYMMII